MVGFLEKTKSETLYLCALGWTWILKCIGLTQQRQARSTVNKLVNGLVMGKFTTNAAQLLNSIRRVGTVIVMRMTGVEIQRYGVVITVESRQSDIGK